MECNFLEEINDISGELNCVYKKIKFGVPKEFEGNEQNGILVRGQNFNILNFPCKSSIVLILEPDTPKISEVICQSGENTANYNVSISIKVSPVLQNDNKLTAPLETLQGIASKSGGNSSENFKLFNHEENSGNYKSNITTADSSPVVKTSIQTSNKCLFNDEGDAEQTKEETKNQSISEKRQENNNASKRLSSIKSSIKRQLTSNRYVDICRNPEWPFIKQTSKVFSKNEQVSSRSQKSKIIQKGTEDSLNNENKDSNLISKKSSRGRTRKWLESLSTLFDGVYTQRSTLGRTAGLGLFSDRHFQKNDIITEFVGWVIDRKEALRLRSEGKATHICDLVKPSLYLDGEKDPKPFIGGGSFANDGSTFLGGPGNNSKFWKWYDEREGRSRVFLKATQEIHPGEEIFVGYCKDYWLDVAENDSANSSCKTNHVASNSKKSNKAIPGGQTRGRKRSIKVLESIDNVEANTKLTDSEKCSSELVSEKSQSSLKESQGKAKSKRKRKSLYWNTVFNWPNSDDD
ncbi:uncharacterized protein cubi_01920 [Cryptosporidium ubiquitum]|uniref:SET domain-containing protein n=1 Tax=Cryptosporidium ubiquitum TaxID=857276 RepID=A0A1J4MMX5_9CRYT|nr:uncharacterized protein cubi_01920 [Cryptosporidium ubiquitum]OII75399.1 hypothetical protein cubi_01920 [Cryptosporidium ubiquitum]